MEITNLIKSISLMVLLVLASCSTIESDSAEPVSNLHEVSLDIEGMTCIACAAGVEYQLKQLDGVVDAKISYLDSSGVVRYDANKLNAEAIALASDVYPATVTNDEKI